MGVEEMQRIDKLEIKFDEHCNKVACRLEKNEKDIAILKTNSDMYARTIDKLESNTANIPVLTQKIDYITSAIDELKKISSDNVCNISNVELNTNKEFSDRTKYIIDKSLSFIVPVAVGLFMYFYKG